MSLTNDALKRAKQTQQDNPPATPPLEFRPVEPGQRERRRTSLLFVGFSLVVVAVVGLCTSLAWYVSQKSAPALLVEASADHKQRAARTNAPTPTKPALVEIPEAANTNNATVSAGGEVVNPAPLKLQGIFFNPKNPSAVVNGRTVYLGERVAGFFVLAMSPSSVTFANATSTNVLSLSQ